jgi:hypothetical protein
VLDDKDTTGDQQISMIGIKKQPERAKWRFTTVTVFEKLHLFRDSGEM